MEKQILEILMDLQKGLTAVSNDITEVKSRLGNVETDVREIKETVNRIEISQSLQSSK